MNGKTKLIKSHRVVAKYFLDDYSEDLTVNHKDFNKENNNVFNLEMLTLSENILHHKLNVIKEKSSSKAMGVGFHKSIGKWTSRVNIDGKRYSLGTYNTEEEAIFAVKNNGSIFIGQGKSNLGKSKYTDKENIAALELSYKIGVRKAGKITKMGSTRISTLRKINKQLNLKD